jgi:hypothetical protein
MRLVLYLSLFTFLGMLYVWSQDPDIDPAAARVMQITLVSLGTGVAVNVLCAAAGFLAVPRGTPTTTEGGAQQQPGDVAAAAAAAAEPWTLYGLSDACMPYSMIAVAIGARLYTFGEPLSYKERLYIQDTPSRAGKFALEMLGHLWEGMEFLFRNLSLIKPDREPGLRREKPKA